MMTETTSGTPQVAEIDTLKPADLVERMKAQNPDLAGKMNDKRMAALVRGTLQALAAEVNEREAGRLRVPGFGRINIREVEREKDGQILRNKRVILRPAQPKA
ncbi:hypothetical protein [Halomonas halodenitrificans]|uniref:hypothetical protein n=1 Tax=Halomonas halodenitrificans TaxID=28252 RepID=UPI0004866F77|nr:hypothetical protein [Halomonas halodenitrificans]